MKVAIINDVHIGIRNSSDIFVEYQRKFFEEVFFPYLLENDIKRVLCLGDLFENRTVINFKALYAFRKNFMERLREHGIHMDVIAGNHDLFYKNTSKISALKELLGHYMGEVTIYEDPTVVEYGDLKVGLIPWINFENEADVHAFLKKCDANVIGAHLELAGFEMYAGMPAHAGMDGSIFSRFDMVLSGHYHTKSTQDNIYYLGSQMEFFWNDCEDKKYFHVLDSENGKLTPVRNPITIFEKIYYDDTNTNYAVKKINDLDEKYIKLIVVNKTKPKEFEKFVDRINSRKHLGLQILENFQDFVGTNVEDEKVSVEDTKSLLQTYVDATDTDLDKERIKSIVLQLLVEAETMEIE